MKIRGLEITRTKWTDNDTFLAVTEEKYDCHYEASYHVGEKRLVVNACHRNKEFTELRGVSQVEEEQLLRFMLTKSGIMPNDGSRILTSWKIEVMVCYSADLDTRLSDVSRLVDSLDIKVEPNGTETDKVKLVGVSVKKR